MAKIHVLSTLSFFNNVSKNGWHQLLLKYRLNTPSQSANNLFVIIKIYHKHEIRVYVSLSFNKDVCLIILEACEVELMLYVFKNSNLIGHDHYRSFKVLQFIRFISGMQSLFEVVTRLLLEPLFE